VLGNLPNDIGTVEEKKSEIPIIIIIKPALPPD